MGLEVGSDVHGSLANQSLARPLTDAERELAQALEQIFASGESDFAQIAGALEQRRLRRPSGADGSWTAQVLEEELAGINASLDEAYSGAKR